MIINCIFKQLFQGKQERISEKNNSLIFLILDQEASDNNGLPLKHLIYIKRARVDVRPNRKIHCLSGNIKVIM